MDHKISLSMSIPWAKGDTGDLPGSLLYRLLPTSRRRDTDVQQAQLRHVALGGAEPKNGIVRMDLAKPAPSQLLQQSHLSTELVRLPVREQNAQPEPFQGNLGNSKLQTEEIRMVSASE